MEPNDRKNALMRAYLLGDLPEADRQEIEDSYFAADEQFDRLAAIEADLVDAYVDGTLTTQERVLFERNYLTSDQRVRHVGFARQLARAARHRASFRERLNANIETFCASVLKPRWAIAIATVGAALIVASTVWTRSTPDPSDVDDLIGARSADGGALTGFELLELGLHIAFVPPEGAVVIRVENGLAQAAGLRVGDVVISINGQQMTTENEVRRVLKGIGPGKSRYLVRRGKEALTVDIDCPKCTSQ
jgi:hypothetical protein